MRIPQPVIRPRARHRDCGRLSARRRMRSRGRIERCALATSGINFGLFCATPGVAVSRNVSPQRALEMLMTGEFIDARTRLSGVW